MAYYMVKVYDSEFKVDAGSPVIAGRMARDLWRDRNRMQNSNQTFRIPEPLGAVVKLLNTGTTTGDNK